MRSLYWLTAITLVAAAVTTVAIADYGRRHPQTVAAWWSSTGQTSTTPACCEKPADTAPTCVVEEMSSGKSRLLTERPPILPPLENSTPVPTLPPDTKQTADFSLDTPKTIRLEDIPEHKQLREEALKNLAVMQDDPPPLPPVTAKQPVAPRTPVVDEFTFTDKPLTPLYVPMRPDLPVVLPPAKMMQDIAKLPNIPGVSLNNPAKGDMNIVAQPAGSKVQVMNNVPNYSFDAPRGAEVMPGLHAARPPEPEGDNPVRDSILAMGELISAINPTTYLMALPAQNKGDKKCDTAFATKINKPFVEPPALCDDLRTKPACSKEGGCCKNTAAAVADDVVVRTYSVAEFMGTGTGHDDPVRQMNLTNLIKTMIAPDNWGTKDSTIEYFAQGKCLVVRHSAAVQDQVEDLLTQLRGQVQKQTKSVALVTPSVRHEPTMVLPSQREYVPLAPRESSDRLPRVITNESNRSVGDDEFFGMIPMRPDGRLMPVPMNVPQLGSSSLTPAQFQPRTGEPVVVEEGPAIKSVKSVVPEFFPWYLPYAPLPSLDQTYEDELLSRKGFTSYTHDEVAFLFLMACEWEEGVR